MKKMFFILVLIAANSFAQDTITTAQVKQYIDKEVWLKGMIASVKIASEDNINYINIDKAFPNNVFMVAITTKYLERLKIKLENIKGKKILVKGKILINKKDPGQVPQIFNPTQIQIK
jgi:hypothetical protein